MKRILVYALVSMAFLPDVLLSQEKSVKPGINDSFKDPKVEDFVEKFEIESREVFSKRAEIVSACQITPGTIIADVGAGTGLFTRLFSKAVGPTGRVIAVDISKKFLEHIESASGESGTRNIQTIQCTEDDSKLPPSSVDAVFICDTYHHFEYPQRTMKSILEGIRPGGRLYLIDFVRIEGQSSEWTLKHVRAGQETVEKEIADAGFQKVEDHSRLLQENYFLVFEKPKS